MGRRGEAVYRTVSFIYDAVEEQGEGYEQGKVVNAVFGHGPAEVGAAPNSPFKFYFDGLLFSCLTRDVAVVCSYPVISVEEIYLVLTFPDGTQARKNYVDVHGW